MAHVSYQNASEAEARGPEVQGFIELYTKFSESHYEPVSQKDLKKKKN